jgi:hypothetical protein
VNKKRTKFISVIMLLTKLLKSQDWENSQQYVFPGLSQRWQIFMSTNRQLRITILLLGDTNSFFFFVLRVTSSHFESRLMTAYLQTESSNNTHTSETTSMA